MIPHALGCMIAGASKCDTVHDIVGSSIVEYME